MITDKSGKVVASQTYYPYGEAYQTKAKKNIALLTSKLFTSQTKDLFSNLYYYHQRYYDPKKVFLSQLIKPKVVIAIFV
jgi:hypothetical protein